MKKSNLVYGIIAIIVLISLVFSATFAYYTTTKSAGGKVNLNVTTPNASASFVSYSSDPLALNVTLDKMIQASTTASVVDNGVLVVEMASANTTEMYCTYDIDFVWDSQDKYTSPTTTLSGSYPFELSIQGSQVVTGDSNVNHTYNNKNLAETNLSTFTLTNNKAKLVSGATIYSSSTTATTATWTFTMKFYTLPTSQSALAGKTYLAHLTTSNVVC